MNKTPTTNPKTTEAPTPLQKEVEAQEVKDKKAAEAIRRSAQQFSTSNMEVKK